MHTSHRVLPTLALAGSAALALAGLALVITRALSGAAASVSPPVAPAPPAVVSAREVCSLSNSDAAAAQIQGADGGASVTVGDRTYWMFGDTLFLAASGKQIEANAIAWSSAQPTDGCPKLTYLTRDGLGVPFIEKDGSLTVWPAGAYAVDDHTFDVYVVYVYGSGPYAYWIGEVGLARVDTSTMQTTVLARSLWSAADHAADQVISASPVDMRDGYRRIVLETRGGAQLLSRVRPDEMADSAKYEYWDGSGWRGDLATAAPLWAPPSQGDALARLGTFQGSASIAYNDGLRAYVALVNIGIDKIGARVASRLEGPWSEPEVWLDCSTVAKPALPVCYSPAQHSEFAAEGGRELFVTFTRMATYDVVAYRIGLEPAGRR